MKTISELFLTIIRRAIEDQGLEANPNKVQDDLQITYITDDSGEMLELDINLTLWQGDKVFSNNGHYRPSAVIYARPDKELWDELLTKMGHPADVSIVLTITGMNIWEEGAHTVGKKLLASREEYSKALASVFPEHYPR